MWVLKCRHTGLRQKYIFYILCGIILIFFPSECMSLFPWLQSTLSVLWELSVTLLLAYGQEWVVINLAVAQSQSQLVGEGSYPVRNIPDS